MMLRRWLSRTHRDKPTRIYAIGDIHGCYRLFARLVGLIRADVGAQPPARSRIVILGDFIDRGPQSAELVEALMRLRGDPGLVVLRGNHEAALTAALDGDFGSLDLWLAHGGMETLASYGVDVAAVDLADDYRLLRIVRDAIPGAVREWLRQLPTSLRVGSHLYVHAGVKPGVPLRQQVESDLLWITDEFIDSSDDHGAVIVHGHTIEDEVAITSNRIGVDTGAYRTGRLSAVAIEGDLPARVIVAVARDQMLAPLRPKGTETASGRFNRPRGPGRRPGSSSS